MYGKAPIFGYFDGFKAAYSAPDFSLMICLSSPIVNTGVLITNLPLRLTFGVFMVLIFPKGW